MALTFNSVVLKDEGSNATGLPVPPEVVAALASGKRPKVTVTLNGYTYRTTVAPMGDVFMLPLAVEHREAAGVNAGDQVEVTLELDTEPRVVDVPDDLAAALAAVPGARAAFDAQRTCARHQRRKNARHARTPHRCGRGQSDDKVGCARERTSTRNDRHVPKHQDALQTNGARK